MQATLIRIVKVLVLGSAIFVGGFGFMQLVPYGHDRSNPAVVQEPAWDSPRTRELAKRACFDCHSNETEWPWYAKVAPMSWVMERHVTVGRSVMNFSDWTRTYDLAPEAGSKVIRREMPPSSYLVLHDHAKLTEDEKIELARGLRVTMGLPLRE